MITKGTLRATEAWTDGRHAEDDKHVEPDYELAVALANATEDAARATVLRITQTEPSHGFVAWQALVDGYVPKSSNDLAIALQPILATPKRCKDAKELKERLTVWSLKVAEYEHQFKTIDEEKKIFVVREMVPKDIKREFLAGPRRNYGETGDRREQDDAVARHTAKDLGVRGVLKRASAACHPESESKRKLHWTQSKTRRHAPQSHTEDHQHQAHDPAPPQGLHRTPTRVT